MTGFLFNFKLFQASVEQSPNRYWGTMPLITAAGRIQRTPLQDLLPCLWTRSLIKLVVLADIVKDPYFHPCITITDSLKISSKFTKNYFSFGIVLFYFITLTFFLSGVAHCLMREGFFYFFIHYRNNCPITVCLSVCLSICLSVCLYVCMCVCVWNYSRSWFHTQLPAVYSACFFYVIKLLKKSFFLYLLNLIQRFYIQSQQYKG